MDQERIGKFIKDLRIKNNLTQEQFASTLGVTYQAVSKWENGKNIPDISILKNISKVFNVSLDDILDSEYSKKTNRKKLYILIIVLFVIVFLGICLIINFSHKNSDFEFKTLTTTCDNFTISGNVSYSSQKSAIYISNINYCGGSDDNKYDLIECILYEIDGSEEIEISKIDSKNEKTTLENFLKNISFVIDNYNSICKKYNKNSFKLLIKATLENKTINYDVPLLLNDQCE